MPATLQPGDRLPNFALTEGQSAGALYDWHQGQPMLLLWVGEATPEAERILRCCEAAIDDRSRLLVLASGQAAMRLAGIAAPSSTVLAVMPQVYGTLVGVPASGWCVIATDPALRVLGRCSEGWQELEAMLPSWRGACADADARAAHAPVLQVPDVLEPEFCREIVDYYLDACGGGAPSGVLRYRDGQPQFTLDPSIKVRREAIVQDAAIEQRIHERLERRVIPEIQRAFHYPVGRREHFKIISYEAGQGYFRAHRDNDTPDVAHRRFAMTLNLNTHQYQGGQLRFPEFGPRLYQAAAGGALIFSCSLLHEVTEIQAGTRYAMTTFFSGDR